MFVEKEVAQKEKVRWDKTGSEGRWKENEKERSNRIEKRRRGEREKSADSTHDKNSSRTSRIAKQVRRQDRSRMDMISSYHTCVDDKLVIIHHYRNASLLLISS